MTWSSISMCFLGSAAATYCRRAVSQALFGFVDSLDFLTLLMILEASSTTMIFVCDQIILVTLCWVLYFLQLKCLSVKLYGSFFRFRSHLARALRAIPCFRHLLFPVLIQYQKLRSVHILSLSILPWAWALPSLFLGLLDRASCPTFVPLCYT